MLHYKAMRGQYRYEDDVMHIIYFSRETLKKSQTTKDQSHI